ncbi:hypothetical protein M3182_25970, partial [Mesobacillus maritimus]|uniref:hypothetical protein n=1 Tax=Mesobacillus maritimus TaxID=1643336 RepID=UPI00203E4384
TSTDVGEPAMQIPILDLFGRIETAEKLGAVARQRYSIYFTSYEHYLVLREQRFLRKQKISL